ncbi:Metal-dependent hydrolase, endonuclease/exonuclease/phosphatase family [Actinoalloteichus cyanogriseus DSM 43889]|uniref:Metal-dependent hydrolase, endonuclease/exonuclease/phosphatase family n=1 Tax=Actinoalloteichus caeruleus DSM 43889 TaxID=1120930 RepID=A0ABT1JBC4_ACTCY|nr:Metal-dependent hydrolase, endonuclease/exonuclease/phosphatase family [Actinoalloteichus caeruleus DSM 43889]
MRCVRGWLVADAVLTRNPGPPPGGGGPDAGGGGRARHVLRTLVGVSACGWTAFVLLNLVVSGRWHLWLAFSVVPPIAYLVGSASLALAVPLVRGGWRLLAVALVGLVAAVPQSGLTLGVLTPGPGDPAGPTVTVVSWNTEYWDRTDDSDDFYQHLRDLDADVYLLQEYLDFVDGRIVSIDEEAALEARFPDYDIVIRGHLVTLSRLPVLDVPAVGHRDVLRVDVAAPGGAALSTYNVHVRAQMDPTLSPLSGEFYRTLRARDERRVAAYDALRASATRDERPGVIGGDLNTTPAMGDLRRIRDLGQDAADAGSSVHPVSWDLSSALRLWRLDWMFVRNGVVAHDYRLEDPAGLSDHSVQIARISVGGDR